LRNELIYRGVPQSDRIDAERLSPKPGIIAGAELEDLCHSGFLM
jgi:hypothetical protein